MSLPRDEVVQALRDSIMEKVALPTVGGKLIEPLSEERLLRYLEARRFDVGKALKLYTAQIEYRHSKFGTRKLEEKVPKLLRVCAATEDKKPQRLVLDLSKFDLNDENTLKYTESIWYSMDKALESKAGQTLGFVLIIDARSTASAPSHPFRPSRLKEFIASLKIPARLKSVLIVGGPRWLYTAWLFALRPILKAKFLSRASHLSLEQAQSLLSDIKFMPPLDVAISRHTSSGPASPHRVFPTDDEDSPTTPGSTYDPSSQQEDQSLPPFQTSADNPPLIIPAPPLTTSNKDKLPQPPASNCPDTPATLIIPPVAPPPDKGISRERILAIRTECDAQSIDIPDGIELWEEDSVYVYFATEGAVVPTKPKRRTSSSAPSDYRQLYF